MSGEARLVFTRENGEQIKFFLHESLADVDRAKSIRLVLKYGGKAVDTDDGVDTVIVDIHYADAETLQDAYFAHPNKNYRQIRVENITFIRQCIRNGVFQHSPIIRHPMRGNGPGRVNYTKADEEKFCRYLAIKIPDARSGGRLGHRIYEDMVKLALVMPREYAWVTRHPPESWREHYRSKKNRERLDGMIERFRHEERPRMEQLYRYDRTLNTTGRIAIIRRLPNEEQEEEESSPDEEISKVVESEDSDDHAHPSSLFSVEDYEDERQSEMEVVKQTGTTTNEPSTSQATLIGPGNGFPMTPMRSSAARQPSDRYERMEEAENFINERPEAPPVKSTSRSRPKRKRAQDVPVPTHEGPLTRSRTRSGGPSAVPDLVASRPRRGRAIGTIHEELPGPAIMNEPIVVPETITEEENVKRLLTADTNGDDSGASSGRRRQHSGDKDEAEGEASPRRRRTLETDDEQIERRLGVLGFNAYSSNSPDPLKLLEEFDSPASQLRSTPTTKAQGGRPSLLPIAGQDGDEDPWRESSEESFPLHGTRASAVKKRVEEKRKKEEYVPPPNTRASRFTRQR